MGYIAKDKCLPLLEVITLNYQKETEFLLCNLSLDLETIQADLQLPNRKGMTS